MRSITLQWKRINNFFFKRKRLITDTPRHSCLYPQPTSWASKDLWKHQSRWFKAVGIWEELPLVQLCQNLGTQVRNWYPIMDHMHHASIKRGCSRIFVEGVYQCVSLRRKKNEVEFSWGVLLEWLKKGKNSIKVSFGDTGELKWEVENAAQGRGEESSLYGVDILL